MERMKPFKTSEYIRGRHPFTLVHRPMIINVRIVACVLFLISLAIALPVAPSWPIKASACIVHLCFLVIASRAGKTDDIVITNIIFIAIAATILLH
jgi:hypothetical protein